MRRIPFAFIALVFLWTHSHAQDSQSLGDVARQARAQKQQKEAQAKDAAPKTATGTDPQTSDSNSKNALQLKTPRVITNEEVPEHQGPTVGSSHQSIAAATDSGQNPANHEAEGEQWKSQIQSQKSNIAELQREITSLSNSVRYAGANCVANCAQWNEHQQQKQQQVETMKAQLEEQQHRLEEMQESARKQGFGSSIYDP